MARHPTIDDLSAIAVPEQPSLSADGRIAYILRTIDIGADRELRSVWTVGVGDERPVQVTEGPSDTAPAWSPDGRTLAFLRGDGDSPAQLWLRPTGGEPRQLTSLPFGAGAPAWSPDGSSIAFVATVDLGEDDAGNPRQEDAPILVERLDYLSDGVGVRDTRRRHLHVVDAGSGTCTRITDGNWDAASPAWSPDGRRLAFTAAMDPDADLTRRSAAYVIEVGGDEAAPRLVGSAAGCAGALSWSADGSALLVAGTTGAPDAHYHLLRVALDDGSTTSLTASLDRNVMLGASPGYPGATPRDAGDGASALFCARERGCTHLYVVEQSGARPVPVVGGAGRNVAGLSVANGRATFVLTTPSSFGEIASVDLATGVETIHTDHGATLRGRTPWARREREFHISDGTTVHGWLMRDPSATGPQPLLLDAHGGPHNAWNASADEVHLYHQELVARGWTVLLLNSRGSDGYGEDFFTALIGAWGLADAQDFLEPLDTLVAEGIADPARLAVTGYSYGGYVTCYLTSRDSRFSAAVAGGCVSDVTSFAGTSDNRHTLTESSLGGPPWGDRAHYAAMNPFAGVDQVTAPTLLLHGEADLRAPIGQAQQWHTALRERGVPTEMVLYPGGCHVFVVNGRPSHRLDYNRRVVDWLQRHVAPQTV